MNKRDGRVIKQPLFSSPFDFGAIHFHGKPFLRLKTPTQVFFTPSYSCCCSSFNLIKVLVVHMLVVETCFLELRDRISQKSRSELLKDICSLKFTVDSVTIIV